MTARTGLRSLYQRLPVRSDLIWNKDRDELFKKYLEQMDEYTGVWKLKRRVLNYFWGTGVGGTFTPLFHIHPPFPKGAKRYSTSMKDCSFVKAECLSTVFYCKALYVNTKEIV